MDRYALEAASQDEEAAASVGIDVTREKLKVTAISAAMCAVGGAIYAQYQMYIGPDTIAGLSVSLNIVFAVIAGGLWTMLGPTFGAVFTQVLSEVLRVTIQSTAGLQSAFGSSVLALDTLDLRPAAWSCSLSTCRGVFSARYWNAATRDIPASRRRR